MTRVLVTGADGQIGRAVSARLVDAGASVTGLSLSFAGAHPADRLIQGDARTPEIVRAALADADAVVHLAAIPHPSLGSPAEVYSVNTSATITVLAEAAEAGVRRAVIASSINAIGYPQNPHRVLPPYFPIDELTPPDIADAYSLSKAADERTALFAARRWGLDVVALRFPLIKWGAALRSVQALYAADPAAGVREGWSYLSMADGARAVERALDASLSGAHIIGLSAAETLLDVPTADLLARYAPGVALRSRPEGRGSLIDTTRARDVLGFEPAESVHDGTLSEPSPLTEGEHV